MFDIECIIFNVPKKNKMDLFLLHLKLAKVYPGSLRRSVKIHGISR